MHTYSISEFRDHLREAFNQAERGEVVHIERFGETFILQKELDPLLQKRVEEKARQVEDATKNAFKHATPAWCGIHQMPRATCQQAHGVTA